MNSRCFPVWMVSCCGLLSVLAEANLIANPSYEQPLATGWSTRVWTHVLDSGTVQLVQSDAHEGTSSARIAVTAATDYSLESQPFTIAPGTAYSLGTWVRALSSGPSAVVSVCVALRDQSGSVVNWCAGEVKVSAQSVVAWKQLSSVFWVDPELPASSATVRIVGTGPTVVLVDDWDLHVHPIPTTFRVRGAPSSPRNGLRWPFSSDSIWNLPIGRGARFVPATLNISGDTNIVPDADLLFLDKTQPMTDFFLSDAGWTGRSRCSPNKPEKVVGTAPFPRDYVIKNDGNNHAAAMLMPDGASFVQTQPLAHCNASAPVTTWIRFRHANITGTGHMGAHGGSGLSAIGGTVRLGEFLPDASGVVWEVRHALKSNLWAARNFNREGTKQSTCFRWPAVWCDTYFADPESKMRYGGHNTAVRPGSLLAIPASTDIGRLSLHTAMGRSLAWTLQNYGTYLVDDTAWDAIAIETELGPQGSYVDQFREATGFSFRGASKTANPWLRDVLLLFQNLQVVDSWDQKVYDTVASSDGLMGSGGGRAVGPWMSKFTSSKRHFHAVAQN
eukprot:m51a1_g7948 hypothetical protein (559) ;mRNA; f:150519-152581